MITFEESAEELKDALEGMIDLYETMMDKVDHTNSFYDANCIKMMNENPLQAKKALTDYQELKESY